MLRFALRRLALAVPLVAVAATLTFFLVQLVPGSPAAVLLGANATQAQVASLEHQLGIDRPVLTQFTSWFGHALTGDLGRSFVNGRPVTEEILRDLPPTLSLALVSTALTVVLGLVLGMAAAVRGGALDRAVQTLCNLGMSIPNFWLAALLILVFALRLEWFPVGGYADFRESPPQWLWHLVLPAVALSISNLAQIAFQARSAVLTVLSRDFVRTLHASGVPRRRILLKHVLRNASVPVVTVAGLTFVFTLGGVVVLELIFGLPGMGLLMLNSVQGSDFSVVQGAVVAFALMVVVVNLVVDLATAALDPRVRVR